MLANSVRNLMELGLLFIFLMLLQKTTLRIWLFRSQLRIQINELFRVTVSTDFCFFYFAFLGGNYACLCTRPTI
jgi:hypothetical protein